MPVEEKTMVPTVIVGVGGTGAEVLSRLRRQIVESYGSLKKLPIISFLWIDTDKDYKVSNPEAAGPHLLDHEKYWAKVSGKDVSDIMRNLHKYPWIEQWFPQELERNIGALEAGAGQIRAYGRFAFFANYHKIQASFHEACARIKGHEGYMQDTYDIRVSGNGLNVFVVGSLSGGTGSGMLIDLGYCIRHWLKGQSSPLVTAMVPMPNAFASIKVGDRVKANGYAALMEMSYFSDYRTEYVAQFGSGLTNEVRDTVPPFDFTYLVGTKNGETEFKLDQLREMISQNIFLDLTSDFAPHKRSIRDNMKGAWAQADPEGRGYPKNFMSFGLSAVEIPIAQIRTTLSHRLGGELVNWWLNDATPLPPNVMDLVQGDILKRMRLTAAELLADISAANEKPMMAEIGTWINSLRNEISNEDKLQCTFQGVNMLGPEKGNILNFLNYLQPKVDDYRSNHLREQGVDERTHGDFLQRMYDNRDRIISQGRVSLEEEFYKIISDRNLGPKFARAFIDNVRQVFSNTEERCRRESEKVWQPNELNRQRQYEAAIREIGESRTGFGLTKQSDMEKSCEAALSGLEGSFIAIIQRKARSIGLDVIAQMSDQIDRLDERLSRFEQFLQQLRDHFQQAADQEADRADALEINGMKLYEREELNRLYQDLIERLAGTGSTNQSRYDAGINQVCKTLTVDILKATSPLWKQTRQADEVMRLLDITQLPVVNHEDFREKIADHTQRVIQQAPEASRLKQELAACDRFLKVMQNEPEEIRNNLRLVNQRSKPLIRLSEGKLLAASFTPASNTKVAVIGGRNSSNPAAIKLVPYLQNLVGSADSITPLGNQERHRIIFVQEVGGFSLRCVEGMEQLQHAYQDWKGEMIEAKRAQLRGESRDLPIPVHIQNNAPFWDIFPEDERVFRLVIQARALGILVISKNKNTQESVVRYSRDSVTGKENVDLASSWEEVTQTLQVLACRPDREEIERQLNAQYDAAAEDMGTKQAIYEQLMAYLKLREDELVKQGGEDSPDYKRELTIVQQVITKHKLKTGQSVGTSAQNVAVAQPKKQSVSAQPHGSQKSPHIGFEVEASDAKYDEFKQYLTQLWNLKIPEDAFVASAQAKASELRLDVQRAEAIWQRFISPTPQLTATEKQYDEHLNQLSDLKIPKNAFISSAKSKANEMGIDFNRAENLWSKYLN